MQKDRLENLARSLRRAAEADARLVEEMRKIAEVRSKAALELHRLCAGFVDSLNKLLDNVKVEFSPRDYSPVFFHDPGMNLFQISFNGRILQISFQATEEMTSTENLRTPYTLQGAVRWFNQQLLERDEVEEHLLFYCLDKRGSHWRRYDPRTHHVGPVDQNYLIDLMEQLL